MISRRNERFRGSRTHGRGKKAGRGKGMRGGHGNAGLHKHRDMYLLKYMRDQFGRHGFNRPTNLITNENIINLKTLQDILSRLVTEGKVSETKGILTVDLNKLGFTKLLSKGTVIRKLRITVDKASPKAIEKVKVAGGNVKVQK